MENQIYTDESGIPSERYQSIAAISGKSDELNNLRKELKKILDDNNIGELKFKKGGCTINCVNALSPFHQKQ